MGDRSFATLADGGGFFEGPRWHDDRWWVSDFYRHTVFAIDADGTHEEVVTVDAQPSGLGWMPDGSLLVVSMKDRRVLRRWPDGSVTVHADISDHCGGHANDVVVDARGHAYVGNFGFDIMAGAPPCSATLVHVAPDGAIQRAAEDLAFPNGSVITPAGSTRIAGGTMGGGYTAFTIGDDGWLTDRRVWASVEGVAPDGCALDAEGYVWAADALGNRWCAWPRIGAWWTRSRGPTASASTPACSGATTAERCWPVRPRTSSRATAPPPATRCCSRPPSTLRTPGCRSLARR